MLKILILVALTLSSNLAENQAGVTTRDGRYLQGSITNDLFKMKTIFGEIRVRVSEIEYLVFSEHDHIVLNDGTVFAGTIELDEIVLYVEKSKVVVPRANLSTIVINPRPVAPGPDPTSTTSIVTADGRKLTGRVEPIIFSMKTDFGHAQFNVEKIASIRLGKTDRVKTASGTKLEGRIKDFKIRLRTPTAVETLLREDIESIEVSQLS